MVVHRWACLKADVKERQGNLAENVVIKHT